MVEDLPTMPETRSYRLRHRQTFVMELVQQTEFGEGSYSIGTGVYVIPPEEAPRQSPSTKVAKDEVT
jgi:hypothetical protein